MLELRLTTEAGVEIRVLGKNGEGSDIVKKFDTFSKDRRIPIHGLYADHTNTIELKFYDVSNNLIAQRVYKHTLGSLISDLPKIRIDAVSDKMAPGMTLVSYFGDVNTSHIYEVDLFGTVARSWAMPCYNFHHTVKEMPKGNIMIFDNGEGRYFGASDQYSRAVEYQIDQEVDYETKKVIFEATITPPKSVFAITFHRTERVELY